MAHHVGIYTRQSEQRASKSEASTETQWDDCVSGLPHWGLEPQHIERYEDLGISAFKDVDRPDYRRLLADAGAGRINVIVVHYMSRFSRRTAQETYDDLSPLLRNGVRIISVGERREFHANNLFALFELLFKLQASHEESLNKSLAVRAAKDLEARLGGCTGKAPFGFTLVRETRHTDSGKPVSVKILTPDTEHEAPIVRRIAELADNWITENDRTGSVWKIARILEKEGHKTRGQRTAKARRDARWDDKTVKRVLADPRIAGFDVESVYGTRKDGTRSTTVAEYRLVRRADGSPVQRYTPIIPAEQWYRIQGWLSDRHPGGNPHWDGKPSGLLSAMKLLFCECGATMTHGGSGFKKHYRCRRRAIKPGQHEGEVTIGAKGIEQHLARRIFAVMRAADNESALAVLAEAANRYAVQQERTVALEVTQERDRLLSDRARLRRSREAHHADRERVMLKGGFVDDFARESWGETEQSLAERMRSIDARIAEIGDSKAVGLPYEVWLTADMDPTGPGSWWDSADFETKRAFFRLFFDRVSVSKARRWAGRGFPVETRVTIEWAGGVDLSGRPAVGVA
ncbi:recombinase family protein [Streptomyces buecherae]|uniref:recombinase family protein n=1 Tax=Streptomyces buecherae TaxID=2763006 RepID=UPI003682B6E6